MALYKCKVIDKDGKSSEFVKEAASENLLIFELNQKNIFPLSVKEVKEEGGGTGTAKSFSFKAVLDFTQTISMLLNAGLSLKDALQIIKTIFTKGPIKRLSDSLDEQIKKGDSFHQALSRFKGSFPPLYIGLVKIGQKVGSLDNIFKKLGSYLEQNKRLKDKLGNALSYPVMILGFAVLGIIGMVFFILPRIKQIFNAMNAAVSGEINKSFAMANLFFIVTIVLIALIGAIVIFFRVVKKSNSPLTETLDRFILRIPFAGKVIFTQEALNFLFALETLTGSGFAVEDALAEAALVFKNKALEKSTGLIREKIIKGEHLSTAFLSEPIFDERIGRWASIGERSGNIEVVFSQLRTYYQDDLDRWTTRLMNLIEPLLQVGVGILVLVMVLVFFVPIYSIYQSF